MLLLRKTETGKVKNTKMRKQMKNKIEKKRTDRENPLNNAGVGES